MTLTTLSMFGTTVLGTGGTGGIGRSSASRRSVP